MQAHQHTIGKAGPIMVPAPGAQNASNQKNQRISALSPNNKIQNSHQIVNNFLNGQEIGTMAKAGHATDGAGGAQSQLSGQKQGYQNKGFSGSQAAKNQANAVGGIRERRNHSIAGYASGLALGAASSNHPKPGPENITSPISIVGSTSIKNSRLLFKNDQQSELAQGANV